MELKYTYLKGDANVQNVLIVPLWNWNTDNTQYKKLGEGF